jgi:predicted TIM-barrel fold metal-dependent hydrolase
MKHKSKLFTEFWVNGKVPDCPIYDMHGHMGTFRSIYFPYPEPAEMVKRMTRAGVKMLVFSHHSSILSPDIANRINVESVRQFPDKLRAYCGINPNYPEIIEKDLAAFEQYKDVYVGLKFLSDYHEVVLTDSRYESAWEFADKKELLVLLHTWGGSIYNGEDAVKKIAEKYHRAKIILGHSCHGKWDEVTRMAKDFPNVYLELCAVLDERGGILEKFVSGAGSEKILFGTDFPWFNHHYYIGAVLAAEITDEDRRDIFYRNAKKLLSR